LLKYLLVIFIDLIVYSSDMKDKMYTIDGEGSIIQLSTGEKIDWPELSREETSKLETAVDIYLDIHQQQKRPLSKEEQREVAKEVLPGLNIRAHFAITQDGYATHDVAGYVFLLGQNAEQYRSELEEQRRKIKELTGRAFDETSFVIAATRYFFKEGRKK